MDEMNQYELTQRNIEEFSRLQSYMLLADKDSSLYKTMKVRYIELKIILTTSGTNLTELYIFSYTPTQNNSDEFTAFLTMAKSSEFFLIRYYSPASCSSSLCRYPLTTLEKFLIFRI